METHFAQLVAEELAPPFAVAGFRTVADGAARQLLVSPAGGVLCASIDPREGVEIDYLDRGPEDGWRRYGLGLFLVKRADRAGIPRTRLPGGPLTEERLRTELRFFRRLLEAVGQDILADDRAWLHDFPWSATPLPADAGRELDSLLGPTA
jgi:hypothetical protein